jgi:capsular exopolysaccharide synthesis family protein
MSKFFEALRLAEGDRIAKSRPGHPLPASAPPVPVGPLTAPAVPGPAVLDVPTAFPRRPRWGRRAPLRVARPGSPEADRYRALGHFVDARNRVMRFSVIGITSAVRREGRTTTAINLAAALAGDDQRVLLIDTDLRHPAIWGLCRANGDATTLADVVVRDCRLAEAARPDRRLPFSVIPAWPPCPTPYDLLRSARFRRLIEEARAAFDYVIVDSPPLVAVSDARVMGDVVDGFLIVLAAGRTPRATFEQALRELDPEKATAIVFNGDPAVRSGERAGRRWWPRRRFAVNA